ncbi:MFS transporter, partial [Leucobacter sp. M11]|nr:MFS transporter [Leucobacter sp. M11]
IQSRLAAELPGDGSAVAAGGLGGAPLPDALHEGFAAAMGQTLFLPAAIAVLGMAATLFFQKRQPIREDVGSRR